MKKILQGLIIFLKKIVYLVLYYSWKNDNQNDISEYIMTINNLLIFFETSL